MTKHLYLDNQCVKEFEATVESIEENAIELDVTRFCPVGGGQPSDQGVIIANGNSHKVVEVTKKTGKVLHHLDSVVGIEPGDKVQGIINWERRMILARYHTASHILSAMFYNKSGALITGNQIDIDQARFDFSLENFDREKMEEMVKEANKAISQNIDVKTYFLPREKALKIPGIVKLAAAMPPEVKELRILEIGEIDKQADGGTHVHNTSEIGKIEIVGLENKGKGRRRVYFKLT